MSNPYNAFFYSFGNNPPVNSSSLISITGYTSLWVGEFSEGPCAPAPGP
jgi:hypothetical protein